jgi:hypothetical protein
MAENGCGETVPIWMVAFAGVTEKETRVGGLTVNPVEPLMLPTVAEMLAAPWIFEVASPPLLMVATLGVSEDQVADCVRFALVPSL